MTIRGDHPTDIGRGGPAPELPHIDDWVEQAVDYLDGRATPEEKAAIEAHLAGCPECSERMAEQQNVVSLMQSIALDEAPVDLRAAVMREVLPSETAAAAATADAPQTPQALSNATTRRRSPWSRLDNRLRRWLPVTAVVIVALVASMTTYAALKQNMHPSPVEHSIDARSDMHDSLPAESMTAAPESPAEDGASAPQTTQAHVAEERKDGGSATTATTSAGPVIAAAEIKEKAAMKVALQNVEDTVFFAFEAPEEARLNQTTLEGTHSSAAPNADEPASRFLAAPVAEDVAEHIEMVIDLECLPAELSLEGPTFAALVSRDQLASLWQLLVDIEAAYGISLSLLADPDPDQAPGLALMRISQGDFPVVYERPSKAADGRLHFSTTSSSPQQSAGPNGATPADDEATHILIIITVRQM